MLDPVDRDLAIRTVLAEAGNQDPLGQAAVAHVIANRVTAGRYGGSTIGDVVLAPNQFEPMSGYGQGGKNDPARFDADSEAYQSAGRIVDAALAGAPDPTGGATHFYSPAAQAALGRAPPAWAKGQGLKIGDHVFYSPDAPDLTQNMGQNDLTASLAPLNLPGAGLGSPGTPPQPAGGTNGPVDLTQIMNQWRQQASSFPPRTQARPGLLGQLLFGNGPPPAVAPTLTPPMGGPATTLPGLPGGHPLMKLAQSLAGPAGNAASSAGSSALSALSSLFGLA